MKNIRKYFVLLLVVFFYSCSSNIVKISPSNLEQILVEFHNPKSDNILIAAHRAMHIKYPENSLAAFRHSIESGVDIIETDIRTTKDGKLILLHDSSIDRTTNGKGKVENFTYAELQKFDLDKDSNDANIYHIPLAEDALNLVHGKIMVDLDIKGVYVKDLVDLVHKTNVGNQVLFFDSDFAVLDSVKFLDPNLMLMPRAHSLAEVKEIINRYHPEVIHIDPSFFNREVVNTIKASGARVWINALGKADVKALKGEIDSAYNPLIKGGANIIQTDLPLTMKRFLVKKDLR